MIDKQIIIDGVDVSGCSEIYNGCCCDNGSFYCKDQPNCKFKLEKRGYKIEQITEFTPKEELIETITHLRVLNAELESYNGQLKESQNIQIEESRILREQLKRKEQECENGIKRIKDLEERIINHSDTIEEYCNKLAKKQQECERLKTQIFTLEQTINEYKQKELKLERTIYEQL